MWLTLLLAATLMTVVTATDVDADEVGYTEVGTDTVNLPDGKHDAPRGGQRIEKRPMNMLRLG
ncbi:hypothetical protein P879_11059 [Paragonimus westermani]|uniref:Uncharacterized protein n=1 Tax=Paragonimus westermani TaxID=34504 RepID=A0A8T0D9Q4_9TREM|nr:hypothetical protein P879_11059 [Paragonimus westermani]